MQMNLTESEKKKIKAKLAEAAWLLAEAHNLIREKDKKGESDLATHVDSIGNDIDDTIDILEEA